jgi:arsenate reductase (thioredoxin)
MYHNISKIISVMSEDAISEERKMLLAPLTNYIRAKKQTQQSVRLNFICTHNSRRSHLAQIWAQVMASHFQVGDVCCYSGGTQATELYPKVADTLAVQGFSLQKISEGSNPVYAIKYDENEPAVIGFSKTFDDPFNPAGGFCAVMTCSSADRGCPFVIGAEARFAVKYDDPKSFDDSDLQTAKYLERSLEIAQEMWFVFKGMSA